uniref:Uncharacterized protein n=1 Tax=Arundo donax TaxID=35708 RepID=A0A0A8Z6L4_ARUDO
MSFRVLPTLEVRVETLLEMIF